MSAKETILEIEKEEMKQLLNAMTATNLMTTIEILDRHLQLLKQLNPINFISNKPKLIACKKKHLDIVKVEAPGDEDASISQTKERYKEEAGKDNSWFRGKLTRQLKGGYVGSFSDVYVPERAIRELELQPFDWIQANLLEGSGKPRYSFMVLERYSDEMPADYHRIEVTCLPVFKHDDLPRFYIKIMEDQDSAVQVLLSEKDVLQFKLNESSAIDYAYFKDHITFGRVTWKHSIYDLKNKTALHTVKMPKKTHNETVNNPLTRTVRPIFQDQTIGMVGGGNRKLQAAINREVERRGGQFVFCTGDEPKTTIKSRLKRSDAIVIFTESISHDAMYWSKEICKEFDIPVSYTKNLGSDRFITHVSDLLKRETQT